MKALRTIILSCIASFAALCIVMMISYFNFETPGFADLLGFGGIFVLGTLLCVPLLYLPTFFVLKKIAPNKYMFVFTPCIVLVANLPVYFIISIVNPNVTGSGEAVLFLIGFFIIAGVFGAGYVITGKES